jgi:phosphoribosylformylglycinamidine cyclo-ligase
MKIKKNDYKSSGVDIRAAEETIRRIKSFTRSTFNKNVLTDIGLFGSFYELKLKEYRNPVLVSSVDGVGTKLKIAFALNKHDTVGQDLVNHCVNDIAVCGAKPLYFLDYLAFGKLIPAKAAAIIEGFSIACKENNCALIGGETAEMPGLYAEDEYDMSGTIVGIVDKQKIIDGRKINKGDILIGFESNGLHTNGYSLARKVLLDKFKLETYNDELKTSLGEELLRIHKSYLNIINLITSNIKVKGFSHITGGGIIGNTMRIIPEGLKLKINWQSWEVQSIFSLIRDAGNLSNREMRKVFNLGIGLIAVAEPKDVDKVMELSRTMNEKCWIIGDVI